MDSPVKWTPEELQFWIEVQGVGFRIQGLGFMVQGLEFRGETVY